MRHQCRFLERLNPPRGTWARCGSTDPRRAANDKGECRKAVECTDCKAWVQANSTQVPAKQNHPDGVGPGKTFVRTRTPLEVHPVRCKFEADGVPVEYCTSCLNDGVEAEKRHVRFCEYHDTNCTRAQVGPNVRACITCNEYVAREGEAPPVELIQLLAPKPVSAMGPQRGGRPPNQAVVNVRNLADRGGAKGRSPTTPKHALERPNGAKPAEWAYGVTTFRPDPGSGVPYRRLSILPRTLASLKAGGFPNPILFVDGDTEHKSWVEEFGLNVVCRSPKIGLFGNWILALGELMIREPFAHYYAVFQDDFVMSRNVRQYIEAGYPPNSYLNLYTFPDNQILHDGTPGWYKANQLGLGAVALVFNRPAAVSLVSSPLTAGKPAQRNPIKRHKFIDGGIVTALNDAGISEFVHSPSIVQHTGVSSTHSKNRQPSARSFKGEDFDMLSLLTDKEKEG